jgi:hypothetical protein
VGTLLRKCLVLGDDLKNRELTTWAYKELIGYEADEAEIPENRIISTAAKGFFIGPRDAHIDEQPIQSAS